MLEVVVDGKTHLTLDDTLTAFRVDDSLYLPLGELMRLVEFPINVDLSKGNVQGWFLAPGRKFSLDLHDCTVSVDGHGGALDPRRLGVRGAELYVPLPLIERWFPLRLHADFSRLILDIRTLETLPLERRAERRGRWARLRASSPTETSTSYPQQKVGYRFWAWPFLDASFQARYDESAGAEGRETELYKLVGAGDLLKMHAQVSLSGRNDGSSSTDAFLTLGRRAPSGGLLGPLDASEYALGDLSTPGDPLIAENALGRGFTLSNYPLDQPQEFDRFDLSGELPLGWDVELYKNDRLIRFQAASARSRYDFNDIPLDFGVNRFRLVFYGPQGQVREKTLQRVIGADMVSPGQHLYRMTAIAKRNDLEYLTQARSGDRIFASYDFGLTRSLSIGGSIKSIILDGIPWDYLSTHVNVAFPGAFGRLELASQQDGGEAMAAVLSTKVLGINVSAQTSRFLNFSSERTELEEVPGQLQGSSELRLSGQLHGPGAVGLDIGLRLALDQGTAGERRQGQTRVSLTFGHTTATHVLESDTFLTGDTSLSDRTLQRLLLSTRRGPLSLRAQLEQELAPTRYLSNIAVSADWTFNDRGTLQLSANRSPADRVTTYGAGMSWQSTHAAIGANLLESDAGDLTATLTVSSSLIRDPTRRRWLTTSSPQAQTGAVAARVFLDDDGDGHWDASEPPVEGARLRISGSAEEPPTDATGDAFVSGLPAYRETSVAVDAASLDNPFWLADDAGRDVVLRPGRTAEIEIPVTPTGSVEGTVFAATDKGFRPVADLTVSLLTKDGKLLRESRSAYDGYYYFDRIPPGSYRLRAGSSRRRRSPRDTFVEIRDGVATITPVDLLDVDSTRALRPGASLVRNAAQAVQGTVASE